MSHFEIDIPVPLRVTRGALTSGAGAPVTVLSGSLPGGELAVDADRARLELRIGDRVAGRLVLRDWMEEERGGRSAPALDTEPWRFEVTVGTTTLAAESRKDKSRRTLRGGAPPYWSLRGTEGSWSWGRDPASTRPGLESDLVLWREEPGGEAVVEMRVEELDAGRVEAVKAGTLHVRQGPSATETDVVLALLLAGGGFYLELAGRNERLSKAAKSLGGMAVDQWLSPRPGDSAS